MVARLLLAWLLRAARAHGFGLGMVRRDFLASECAIRRLIGNLNVRSRGSTDQREPERSLFARSAS